MSAKSGEEHHFYGKKRPEHAKNMSGINHPMYGKVRWWENGNLKYTNEYLNSIYDPSKTIHECATIDGKWKLRLSHALVKYIKENNIEYLPGQKCMGDIKYPKEYLNKIYNPNKTIMENSIVDGNHKNRLHKLLVKYVIENDLPYLPNQRCIKIYKTKHNIT